MKHILAIDQSTSATKALLFDETGAVVDRASREHRQIYPRPGWVEHDAEDIWQNVQTVVHEIVGRQAGILNDLAGLAITNQRETILVFERRTGKPLCHAIVWQCRRGEPICRELRTAGHEEAVAAKTGLKLDTYFSGPKLKWLLRENPSLAKQLDTGDALIGTIDTYLVYRMSGGAVFATDHTNASRTLLYNIRSLQWDDQLCGLFDVPTRAVAEVRESTADFGVTDAAGILPKKVPICGVMGDSQASLFAQRCFEPGMAKVTFGSGTSVLLNVGERTPRSTGTAVTALAWVLGGRPTYALEGIINYSSATIAWLKDQLGLINDAAETEALAGAVRDNGGVYLVPAFSGLSAPYWNPNARAAILGITAHTRREHIVRAALESIAYQLRDVLDKIHDEAGVAPHNLRADGGPTRNELLMQYTADILGVELEVAHVAEASACGAAMASQLGLGMIASIDELAALPRPVQRYHPQMAPGVVEKLYSGWQAAVQRVL
jgi:glycerol kinase